MSSISCYFSSTKYHKTQVSEAENAVDTGTSRN